MDNSVICGAGVRKSLGHYGAESLKMPSLPATGQLSSGLSNRTFMND